jgi:hypothetical protein
MEISISELEQIRHEYTGLGKRLQNRTVIRRLEREVAKYKAEPAAAEMAWVLESAIALIKGEQK